MKCDKCSAPAVLFQRYSGLHLCKTHFAVDVEKKIKKELRKEQVEGKLAVALSGGKDSAVVLSVLNDLLPRRGIEIIAITIDEGISGYRDKAIKSAASLAAELGVQWEVATFEEYFGVRIDEVHERPCSLCGILRRSLLNRLAKTVGASILATGHNLDDEAQTVQMNYLRGDTGRLLRLDSPAKKGLVRRVKPLKYVPEKEVALYAILKDIPINLNECKFSAGVFRAEIRDMLSQVEMRHPGTKYALIRGLERISKLTRRTPFELNQCARCGEPAVATLCQTCDALGKIYTKNQDAVW